MNFLKLVKKINLKLEAHDHNDLYAHKPFYCLRFFACLSNSPSEDSKNMQNLCKGLVNNNRVKYQATGTIFFEEILYHRMKNLKISQNSNILSQFNLDFFVEKSGN